MKAHKIVKVLKYAIPFVLGAFVQFKRDRDTLNAAIKNGDVLLVPKEAKILINAIKERQETNLKPVQ